MERGVVCEVTPIGLLAWGVGVFLLRWGVLSLTELTELTEHFSAQFNSWKVLSLTELTDLTEHICALFRTHRTPSAYRIHRTLLLSLGWYLRERRVSRVVKSLYNPPSWPPSQHTDVIAYNRGYNPQVISVLCFAFEYMPFLLVENALLVARRACSQT